jgi:hypothetical protein
VLSLRLRSWLQLGCCNMQSWLCQIVVVVVVVLWHAAIGYIIKVWVVVVLSRLRSCCGVQLLCVFIDVVVVVLVLWHLAVMFLCCCHHCYVMVPYHCVPIWHAAVVCSHGKLLLSCASMVCGCCKPSWYIIVGCCHSI